jgi:chemotaxis signal transduction protein
MSRLLPRTVRILPGAAEVLESRAKSLVQGLDDRGRDEDRSRLAVTFELVDRPYAVDLSVLESTVAKLGRVTEIAGAATVVRGVAFVDNVAQPVLDLVEQVTGRRRRLEEIAHGPAFIVREGSTSWAVAVEGPLELLEVDRGHLDRSADLMSHGVGISGRLEEGQLILSKAWLREWLLNASREGASP